MKNQPARFLLLLIMLMLLGRTGRAAYVWIEGEAPTKADVKRHPWWYDKVKTDELSGGDMISNWDDRKAGELEYDFQAPAAGQYEFWVRANPVGTKLTYQLNGGPWNTIDFAQAQDRMNIAADDKFDIRFIAWDRVDEVKLGKGANTVRFRMESENNHHGMLDCFVFSDVPFQPQGSRKPGQAVRDSETTDKGWLPFDPPADEFKEGSAIDLRSLNEKFAGEGGFIATKGGEFIHSRTGEPIRFWGVNGPPGDLKDPAALKRCARMLAKHGVNLARIHGAYFNEDGSVNFARVTHAQEIVAAMKSEGIYSHFSIYFPLWLSPKPGDPWLPGYDGTKHPFAALYFNPPFQQKYREWWKALLTTPAANNGAMLIDDPAVASVEIINEDSYLFFTFNENGIPGPEMEIVESQFGKWLATRYGSIDAAFKKWNAPTLARDNPAAGRVAFRPLWNMANQRTERDKDTITFLVESQREFYRQTYNYLRSLGFKGAITASNWATASPQYFGPLEKYSYTVTDFIDRHGYFDCNDHGPSDGWAILKGQTYCDRSALRFDPVIPGKPKSFVNPVMDPHYDDKPSVISETTFNRPNRYRSEAPLYYACYGALQNSNAIHNFALDGDQWHVKPGYFMQPWTLMSPAMMGQFPAAALIYRLGLVTPGDELVNLNLKIADLENLSGTPMPQDAAFDAIRAADVPTGTDLKPGNVIDPLVHYAGRTNVHFTAEGGPAKLVDLAPFIDRLHETVVSSNGQLKLDYGKGVLTINAPSAQGISGDLKDAGPIELKDLSVSSEMPLGHIVAVSLDGKPLATSDRILLQVMSEERSQGWKTQSAGEGVQLITDIGHDPWMIKGLEGTVKMKRSDAGSLNVTALDLNGYVGKPAGKADAITLKPDAVYYLVSH